MADDGKAGVLTESSTVGVQNTAVEPEIVVENFTGKQRDKWLAEETDFPVSKKDGKAESSPADKEAEKSDPPPDTKADKDPESAEEVAAAAAAKTQQEQREIPESEKRIKKLLSDNKILQQRLESIEKGKVQPKAPEPTTTEQLPSKPDPEKFQTMSEYLEALTDWKTNTALATERKRVAEESSKAQATAAENASREQWNGRVTEARTKHADFDTVALDPDLPIAANSTIDLWVMNSELGADVLYYYGQHREELVKLNAMPPIAAARELARIENEIAKPAAAIPVRAKVPQAPPPPTEVHSKGSTDPIAAALQAGDFATYQRLKNAEERGSSK